LKKIKIYKIEKFDNVFFIDEDPIGKELEEGNLKLNF
jgi:hypothetical protein